MTMQLPQTKQTRGERTPLDARVMLAGTPKVGKSTLLANWAPDTTLFIDTHNGTALLEGEHFVQHVASFTEFEEAVDLVVAGGHPFKTVGVDLVDDVWKFADLHAAQKKGQVAAGLIEYGKGTAEAEGLFRRAVGKLLAAPIGVWFLTHTDTVEEGQITRYVPKLDKRVKTYVQGACDFVFLAESLGNKRVLHTQPSAKFEAGSRVPLPEPMDLGNDPAKAPAAARNLYAAIKQGLKPAPTTEAKPAAAPKSETKSNEKVAA